MDIGIIAITNLEKTIDQATINLLVEHGLLISREDLLMEDYGRDSDGYIKFIPC